MLIVFLLLALRNRPPRPEFCDDFLRIQDVQNYGFYHGRDGVDPKAYGKCEQQRRTVIKVQAKRFDYNGAYEVSCPVSRHPR